MLFAMSIPAEEWIALESEFLKITLEICQKAGIAHIDFKLHAWEFFSIHKFRNITLDERADFALRIAKLALKHNADFTAVYVEKKTLQNIYIHLRAIMLNIIDEISAELGTEISDVLRSISTSTLDLFKDPYIVSLISMLHECEKNLSEVQKMGIIIIDRQSEYSKYHNFKTLVTHRERGRFKHLIEQPLEGNGSIHILLQMSDLLGYLAGADLLSIKGKKNYPDRHTRTIELIRENTRLIDATATIEPAAKSSMLMMAELSLRHLKLPYELAQLSAAVDTDDNGIQAGFVELVETHTNAYVQANSEAFYIRSRLNDHKLAQRFIKNEG